LPSIIEQDRLIKCLEENLPMLKQVKQTEENVWEEEIEKINPLKVMIDLQLSAINNIKPKEKEEKTETGEEVKKEEQVQVEHAQTGLATKVLENNVPTKFTNSYHGVQVRNETGYGLTEEMLEPDITVNNENVLIFHTHTCESYTPSEQFQYQQTGTYRTTDLNYNVARVGTELKNQLDSYGYHVLHDKTYHDYPAYNGSYTRSSNTVSSLLTSAPTTQLVIDLHRDAIGSMSNYAPCVKIGDETVAQLMFVIGTNGGGLTHNNWQTNLKFAVKIQEKANELYPGLFRPIIVRNSRYNQNLADSACIIEVGATGNTLEQATRKYEIFIRSYIRSYETIRKYF